MMTGIQKTQNALKTHLKYRGKMQQPTKQELWDKIEFLDNLLDSLYRKCVHSPYDKRSKLLRYLDKVYPECGVRCVKKRSELARGKK